MSPYGMPMELKCIECGVPQFSKKPWIRCVKCGGRTEFIFRESLEVENVSDGYTYSMWRYKSVLPIPVEWSPVSLLEGYTPLIKAERLGSRLGFRRLYLKDDSRNPTGSFRDRSASLMVTWAYRTGFKTVIAASNGNMGVSLAAYAARVGLNCKVVAPKKVDEGKVLQLLVYGSDLEEHGLHLDDAIEKASKMADEHGFYQATPELNPLSIEAQKTIAYEIWEQLSEVPDVVVAPVGSGSCLYSIWKGFRELQLLGLVEEFPRFVAVQAEGCAPVVEAFRKGVELMEASKPKTRATAILVRKPIYGYKVLEALKSRGAAVSVKDYEMFKAERELARLEGLFVEPSSSSTIVALQKLMEEGFLDLGETVVCILTGSGLKAPSVSEFLGYRRRMIEIASETSMKMRILKLLNRSDKHGYAVWKALKAVISMQAVYQHLQDLEKRGYVESFKSNGKRFYRLTDEGEQLLKVFKVISKH